MEGYTSQKRWKCKVLNRLWQTAKKGGRTLKTRRVTRNRGFTLIPWLAADGSGRYKTLPDRAPSPSSTPKLTPKTHRIRLDFTPFHTVRKRWAAFTSWTPNSVEALRDPVWMRPEVHWMVLLDCSPERSRTPRLETTRFLILRLISCQEYFFCSCILYAH